MGCCGGSKDNEVEDISEAGDTEKSKGKSGEPTKYDPSFNGPIKNRSCTDVICCLLFCICFLGMIAVAALAFSRGDPVRLLYPTDSSGNMCGTGEFADKPNLFFFDLVDCARMGAAVVLNGCPTPQVYIGRCPNMSWAWQKVWVPNSNENEIRKEMICKYNVDPVKSPKVCVASCPSDYYAWYTSVVTGDTTAEREKLICKSSVNAVTSSKVCVANCPTTFFTWGEAVQNPELIDNMVCRRYIDPRKDKRTIQELVADEDCAAYYVKSTALVGRCIPSIFATILNKTLAVASSNGTEIRDKLNQTVTGTQLEEGSKYLAYFLSAQEYGVKIYQDVRSSWWMILIGLGLAMLLAFIWIIIMRWIAGIMVWLSIILFIGLFGFSTYYCINKYFQLKDNPESALQGSLEFTTNLSYYTNLYITWLVFGCISGAVLLITVILVIFLRKRIMIAISLIKESSRAVGSMIFTLFFPLVPFVMQVVLFTFWGASALYLASSGSASYSASNKTLVNVTENVTTNGVTSLVTSVQEQIIDITGQLPCDSISGNSTAESQLQGFCNFVKYGGDEYTIYLQFYQLFMLFWCMNFIVAFCQMSLAGAFASYYWAFNKPADIPMFPVAASLWRSLRYHLGTIAFGSLIIAIIQIIRVLLEYLDHKLKGSENQVAKFFLKCLKCCFWCLEKFMKFLNKNAYILVAIYGKNFCTSAKNAFFLIIRNIVRVAVVDKVTDLLLFISKLFVVGAIGTISYLFFSGTATTLAMSLSNTVATVLAEYTPALNFYLIPVIIICLGSFGIASAFFSVYSMAVDTLFLCFLEDLERHDGSEEKPYYMSKELMSILGKKNKVEKTE